MMDTRHKSDDKDCRLHLLALRDSLAKTVTAVAERPEPETEFDTGSTDDLLQFLDRKLGVSE